MSRYITLGADRDGEVYGLEVNDDGTLRRNPLGCSTSCAVIRPVTKANYEYMTEDPESVEDLWKAAVAAGETQKGLDDWFKDTDAEELMDKSFVHELLENADNLTVNWWHDDRVADGDHHNDTFRQYVEERLVESDEVPNIESKDDVHEWEASGCFPPTEPFAVEFAPKAVLEEYYAHLRETYKEFKE